MEQPPTKKKPKGLAKTYDRKALLARRWYHFLAPKYWPTWLLLGFLRATVFLPYSCIITLGKALGLLFMTLVPSRKKIADINLALCFPELSEEKRRKLLKESFQSTGIGFLEAGLAWWASNQRLKKMLVVKDKEYLLSAKSQGNGTLLLTCHFTTIELGIRLLSLTTKTNVMYRPQKNTLFEWALQKNRARYVAKNIEKRDLKGMLKALKEKDSVTAYTPDQDTTKNLSVFAPFFGVPASTITATAFFTEKTKCAILPGFYYRDMITHRCTLEFYEPLKDYPSGEAIADATRINKLIEDAIRKHPEQYMWTHRRFKTQPDGSPKANLYR